MDEIRILKAQIEALVENLARAKKAMGTDRIDDDLRKDVIYRFEWKARESEEQLEKLRGRVDHGEAAEACWKEFRELRKDFEGHFRECLAFLEGALIRSAELDNRLCIVADALMRELSRAADCKWERFTIMADDDLFTDISEIIRLRFPEFSIWHLPAVVHELGHFVAENRYEVRDLFKEIEKIEDEEGSGACNERTLHEQFADFFAVNALGPAFACSCIFLDFNPTRIFEGRSGHPPDYERVHLIINSLKKIDEKNPKRHYILSIDMLDTLWQCSLKASKKQGLLTSEQMARLDNRLDKFCSYKGVGSRLKNIRYNSKDTKPPYNRWPQVSFLSNRLELETVENIFNSFGHQFILRDILNAAWDWRLKHPWEDYKKVGQKALDLCLKMIDSGQFDV